MQEKHEQKGKGRVRYKLSNRKGKRSGPKGEGAGEACTGMSDEDVPLGMRCAAALSMSMP